MSGVCIDKLPHSCGTRQGLQVFADESTGTVNGYCFSCKTFVANPYGKPVDISEVEIPEPKSDEEVQLELAEISGYTTVDVKQRKLRAKYLEEFGIKVSLSEADGKTPTALYFPMVVDGKQQGYYAKTLGDNSITWSIGNVRKAEPFNWHNAKRSGAYTLIITEGKEDAVAVRAIFDMHGKEEYQPAVIALPNGCNSVKHSLNLVAQEAKRLFKQIIIVFDHDKVGEAATKDAMMIFPGAHTVTLPEKDPNDCLIKGAAKSAFRAMAFQSDEPKKSRLLVANPSLHEEYRAPVEFGNLSWPFPTMNKLLRNMRTGETIYIGAGVKMGKSDFLNAIAAHLIEQHGVGVLMMQPEETLKLSYKKILGKIAGSVFDDPEVEVDQEKYDEAGKVADGKLILMDSYQYLDWDDLKEDIVHAASLGVKAVFIDPITNITAGMNSADTNSKLHGITRDLSALAKDLDMVIFITSHLKSPDGNLSSDVRAKKYGNGQYHKLGNCPHERGGDVLSNQFAGSRAMMQSCNLMLGFEGNKDPDLPENIRNFRWVTILEDRGFGNSDSIQITRDKYTTKFREV